MYKPIWFEVARGTEKPPGSAIRPGLENPEGIQPWPSDINLCGECRYEHVNLGNGGESYYGEPGRCT